MRWALRGMIGATSAVIGVAVLAQSGAPLPADFPRWAFPGPLLKQLDPGSQKFAEVQIFDRTRAVDWHPENHPAMPEAVKGRPPVFACGFCHLPEGAGRPENAALAGLPEEYLLRQIHDFRSGARKSADPAFSPVSNMTTSMKLVPEAQFEKDAQEAAHYYASLKYTKHLTLIESTTAPAHHSNGYVNEFEADKPTQPIGYAIVEGPADFDRFEHRDAALQVKAYVPVGSIARGRALATGKSADLPACATCHGEGLKGGLLGPPLAGRLPTGIFRQLYGFQTGARNGEQAALMKPIVAKLTQKEMVDIAAYVASLEP